MQAENITITCKSGALTVFPGTPREVGFDPAIKSDRLLLTLSDIRLTVWFIGEVSFDEKRSVALAVINWLKSYRRIARPLPVPAPLPVQAVAQ